MAKDTAVVCGCEATHLLLSRLHVSYQVVDEGRQDWQQQRPQTTTLNQTTDELKHSKHTGLHGNQLAITITLITSCTLTVHHPCHISVYCS